MARIVDPIIVAFAIDTPPGTPVAAPQTTVLAVRHGILEVVDVTVPPGHAGLTGLQLQLSSQILLPWAGVPPWIIGDDLQEQFPVNVEVDTKLAAVTYNLGAYTHRHLLRCRIRQNMPTAMPGPVTLIPLAALNGN